MAISGPRDIRARIDSLAGQKKIRAMSLLSLPNEIILEIMLHLNNEPDYFAILTTCKQISGLKDALKKLQGDKNIFITNCELYEGEFADIMLLVKGKIIASSYFGVKSPIAMTLGYKMRVNVSNFHKIQNMCKLAGNNIVFRKKTYHVDTDEHINFDKKYIEITFSWTSGKFAAIKIADGTTKVKFKFGAKWTNKKVNLTSFYDLYYDFYHGTMFEGFPGKILLDALKLIEGLPES